MDSLDTKEVRKYWSKRILITVWFTYAAFYLLRVNMSVALPGIMSEYGLSKTVMGGVFTALFAVYAIGQFVNGQLGDKFKARTLITIGLLVSAVLNIIFGFTNGVVTAMMLIWGLNGFFQSMGWGPSVKTIASWFPRDKRGKIGGLLGTSYQVGNAASWALAGFVVGILGWRWAFWIPAVICIAIALHWFFRGKNAPEEVGLLTLEEEEAGIYKMGVMAAREDDHLGFKYTLKQTLKNPTVWCAGLALLFLNIVRYGFMDWAPTFMFEVQKATISVAAFKAIVIPAAGCLGAIIAGFVSDKYLKGRRAPIIIAMLLCLGVACWLYPKIPLGNWQLSLACLALIGFMTYGPHVMIVTILPMDLGTRKAASSAAGFIDSLGYVGASLTGIGTGFLIDHFSWQAAFDFWVSGALLAAFFVLFFFWHKPVKGAYH